MIFVPVDLDIPERGQPSIAYARGHLAEIPVVTVVIPPGGDEESARLFAVVRPAGHGEAGPVFAERRRPPAVAVTGHVLEPVDPETVPRLFERGEHPGNLAVTGMDRDARGRLPVAALCFLDLSRGLSAGDSLITPMENRLALAEACSYLEGTEWGRAAEQLDPGALMRDGVLPVTGGMPMTEEGFHGYMLEGSARANAVRDRADIPMCDYRLFDAALLAAEIRGDAGAVLSVQRHLLVPGHPAHALLSSMSGLADAVAAADTPAQTRILGEVDALLASVQDGSDEASREMVGGVWAGAHLWRNLLDEGGTLATARRRLAAPDCDGAVLARMALLGEAEGRAFRDPGTTMRSLARRVDDLPRRMRDRHRPFLLLPSSRLSVSEATGSAIADLDKAGLRRLVGGNAALLEAFRDLPNAHPEAAAMRDALLVGLARLGREAARRGMDGGPAGFAPATPAALARPWLFGGPSRHPVPPAPPRHEERRTSP